MCVAYIVQAVSNSWKYWIMWPVLSHLCWMMSTSCRTKLKRKMKEKVCKEPQWVKPKSIEEEWVNFFRISSEQNTRRDYSLGTSQSLKMRNKFSILSAEAGCGAELPWQTNTTKVICLFQQSTGLFRPVMTWQLVILPKLFWASSVLTHPCWPSRLLLPMCLRG